MEDEKLQALWDDCIVRGFKSDVLMNQIVMRFLLDVNPSLLILGGRRNCDFKDISEAMEFMGSLNVRRRCRDRGADGDLYFMGIRGGVRPFIAARSPQLFECLLSGNMSVDEVLKNINSFKWTRRKEKNINAASKRKSYNKKKDSGVKVIKARSLSKKHDWDTVK